MMNSNSKALPLVLGALTYVAWGLLPLFWMKLKLVSSLTVLSNRIIWGTVFLMIYILLTSVVKKKFIFSLVWPSIAEARRHLPTAILLSLNWGTYIWAVNNGYLLASSLGYFLAPLFYLLAGIIVFKEEVTIYKCLAGALGILGLVPLIVNADIPTFLISLMLALSIVTYGILRKSKKLDAVRGTYLESLILTPLAFMYLMNMDSQNLLFFDQVVNVQFLLVLSGVVTALPLITYSKAIVLIPLSEMAFLQYISPILQFLLAYFYFDEQLSVNKWISFILIWLAVVVMILEARRKSVVA